MIFFLALCIVLFMPDISEAWGPLTHVYLANQVLELGVASVPPAIYTLIRRCKDDFFYGNLSADIILGKRFQRAKNNSHSWNIGWRLLGTARSKHQKAFAYGYLTHLCADTVVHNLIRHPSIPLRHPLMEIKSDSIVDKKYRRILNRLDKPMQKRNDLFLEQTLESVIFSFKTNRRIFKGFLVLSGIPSLTPVSQFIDRRFPYELNVSDIKRFREESISRMIELLKNGKDSKVLSKNPLMKRRRIVRTARA